MRITLTPRTWAVLGALAVCNILNFMPGPYHWQGLFLGIISAQYAFWLLMMAFCVVCTWLLIYKTDFYTWAHDEKVEPFLREEGGEEKR